MKTFTFLSSILFTLLFTFSGLYATSYKSIADGDFTDPAVWASGMVPPTTIPVGDTVLVQDSLYGGHDISVDGFLYSEDGAALDIGNLTVEKTGSYVGKGNVYSGNDVTIHGYMLHAPTKLLYVVRDLDVTSDGLLENFGNIYVSRDFRVWGDMFNLGFIDISRDGFVYGSFCGMGGTIRYCKKLTFHVTGTVGGQYLIPNPACGSDPEVNDHGAASCGAMLATEDLSIGIQGEKAENGLKLTVDIPQELVSWSVERAGESYDFQVIDLGMGTSILNAGSFSLNDPNPIAGKNIYRVTGTDPSGTVHQSRMIEINFEATALIQIFPNPASEYVSIDFSGDESTFARIELRSITGSLVLSKQVNPSLDQRTQLEVSKIQSGMYLVLLKFEERQETHHLVLN